MVQTTTLTYDPDELTARYGSPLYVYDLALVKQRAQELKEVITWPKFQPLYAMKANSCPAIIAALNEQGYGIDAVSPGEVALALRAGVPAERILLTENNMTDAEMFQAVEQGVVITCGSLDRLERLARQTSAKQVAVRINPRVGDSEHAHTLTAGPLTKFGIHHSQIDEILRIERETGIEVVGCHMHIGSNVLNAAVYGQAMEVLLAAAGQLPHLQFIDFGGGLGVPYHEDQAPLDLAAVGQCADDMMAAFCQQYGRELEMRLEPGRFLVAEAGTLLTCVTSVKTNPAEGEPGEEDYAPARTFIGCDSGFNHLIRPCMYGSYHPIENISRPLAEPQVVDVVGNVCESGDIFARDRLLPLPQEGDMLAIGFAGAYGASMASTYNTRSLPAEVVIDQGRSQLARRRRSLDELLDDWTWPNADETDE